MLSVKRHRMSTTLFFQGNLPVSNMSRDSWASPTRQPTFWVLLFSIGLHVNPKLVEKDGIALVLTLAAKVGTATPCNVTNVRRNTRLNGMGPLILLKFDKIYQQWTGQQPAMRCVRREVWRESGWAEFVCADKWFLQGFSKGKRRKFERLIKVMAIHIDKMMKPILVERSKPNNRDKCIGAYSTGGRVKTHLKNFL